MKLKLITLFFSILLILLLVNACKKRRDEPQPKATILYGKVVNKKTGDPIKGAEMLFQDHEYSTPNSGDYSFQEMAGEYSLVTDHDDYHKDSINVILKSNESLMKYRRLIPKRSIVHATHQDDLHFESTTDTLIIEIENVGIEESLVWKAESNRAWLIVLPTEGTISGEGNMQLEITIDIDQLTVEKDTGTVTITNGIYTTQSIEVSICAEKDNIEVVEDPMESLREGLVAYYPFNGNTNDESGNDLHGTILEARLTMDRKGNSNAAFTFDGIDDRIEISNNSLLENQMYSLSVWFKAQNDTGALISLSNFSPPAANCGYYLSIHDNNIRGISQKGGYNWVRNKDDEEITLNQWYHAVFTYDGTILKLFSNGSLISTVEESHTVDYSEHNPLQIGTYKTSTGQTAFEGDIDDIRIYNRALTEEEVILLYNE